MLKTERIEHRDLETDIEPVSVEFNDLIWTCCGGRSKIIAARQSSLRGSPLRCVAPAARAAVPNPLSSSLLTRAESDQIAWLAVLNG
ncbi:hypothetical protein [Burkholderia stagnalis]|uniref:hypothetical protein n=1 Tax=Burkholderia stagnalis TaxID=1503054 RepID=UPI0014289FDD|nr:hypothetical protein [Burkholderia stagnalis]